MMVEPPLFRRLAVLGLGLIGGSFALAARERGFAREIVAFDPDVEALAEAAVAGIVEQGYSSARDAVAEADIVILAAPIRAILALLREIAPVLGSDAFVMDLGSTKQAIVSAMDRLPAHVVAVGGHPMAGKEVAGFGAAEASLFHGATFALCATARTSDGGRRIAEQVAGALGARPLWMDAATHDAAAARISHLPYILSAALAHAAAPEGVTRELASSGYRDTSRLAASNPAMMLDILLTNSSAVRAAVAGARGALDELEGLVEAGDEDGLRAWIETARRVR